MGVVSLGTGIGRVFVKGGAKQTFTAASSTASEQAISAAPPP